MQFIQKNKKNGFFTGVFFVMLLAMGCINGICFSEMPTYIDDYNDHHQKDCPEEDIWKVWIDNNATHIMFKVELNGSFLSSTEFGIYISTNDNTGSNDSGGFAAIDGPLDFLADYCLYLDGPASNFHYLEDENDATITPAGPNDLIDNSGGHTFGGLGYVIFSNNNRTLEIGYKLQTAVGGNGYLDIALGQTIKCKIKCYADSDFAPDLGESPILYTLKGGFNWIIILIIIFPVIGVAIGLFFYYRRKEVI